MAVSKLMILDSHVFSMFEHIRLLHSVGSYPLHTKCLMDHPMSLDDNHKMKISTGTMPIFNVNYNANYHIILIKNG